MADILALQLSSQPFPLFQAMRHFKHPRARDVIVAGFDAVEYIAHLWTGTVELGIVGTEEGNEVVGGEMTEGAAVCVLGAGLILGQDGLTAQMSARTQLEPSEREGLVC